MQWLHEAMRKAIIQELERLARAGYAALPDSELDADDWSTAEEFCQ